MQKVLIGLTDGALEALDMVRGTQARGTYLESLLWRQKAIRDTGVEREARPQRGKWDRETTKK